MSELKSATNSEGCTLTWLESETEPCPIPETNIWYRPSDGAHFSWSGEKWVRYEPVNLKAVIELKATQE